MEYALKTRLTNHGINETVQRHCFMLGYRWFHDHGQNLCLAENATLAVRYDRRMEYVTPCKGDLSPTEFCAQLVPAAKLVSTC